LRFWKNIQIFVIVRGKPKPALETQTADYQRVIVPIIFLRELATDFFQNYSNFRAKAI
jgi:hypothetical protein